MTSGSRRRRRSPEQWQQLIEAQAASGQALEVFCATHGLARSTFQRWRSRLKSGMAPAAASEPTTQALFTPLLEEQAPSTASRNPDHGWDIELDLGGGMCLRLRRSAVTGQTKAFYRPGSQPRKLHPVQ